MQAEEILSELQQLGADSYKRVLVNNHGVKDPCFGVKIGDLKKIQKRIKVNHDLALALYDSGNYDAMYLAGMIADDARFTKKDLNRWAAQAYGGALAGTTVASVAAGNSNGWGLALEWIDSPKANVAEAGWSTLSSIISVTEDTNLDLDTIKKLIKRVEKEIHTAPDRVRYAMNNFIIASGSFVKDLTSLAIETGKKIGNIEACLGNNSCQIPFAPDYIRKVEAKGCLGKKRKSAKC